YAKDSPTTFFNPTTVTTQIGSPTVDATHTGSNLAYIGMFYNHGGSGTDYGLFDDIYIPGTAVPSTFVQFTSASGSAGENAGTYTMNISITNPHSTIATTADVALIGGTATNGSDISTYTTQGITFSSGGSANQTVNITITNDSDFEGTENLVFELQNVSGGQNAQAGTPETHNLNIIDDEVPRLMISEVADPSDNANVRYVELYNHHSIAIDFSSQTWYLCRQNNGLPSQRFDIQLTGSVAAHEIFVVAVSQADFFSTFGYNPDQSDGSCDGDGRDGYFLYFNGDHSSGTLVDSYGVIDVDGESQLWDYIDGHAERNAGVTGPNPVWTYTEWTVEQPITTSELSPDDTPLPVQLKSFSAIFRNDVINITWVTSSEVNTLGYIILRAEEKDGNYEEISSYISNPALMGAGFSNVENTYHFTDHLVTENKTYWYKLIDVSADGSMGTHGPIVAVNDNLNIPVSFSLEQNYPNPFNPSTNIAFNIPLLQENFINIDISVFDILGRRITTLIKGHVAPGRYLLSWDGKDQSGTIVAAGIYIYKFTSNLYHKSRKMIFLK
ncbi:MAG: T9SS type A sorting domain-containing protein, partial [Calditrichia bacterium]|nr:T9SS type A sorting domain-containing protein [Calditrichia bacterium]